MVQNPTNVSSVHSLVPCESTEHANSKHRKTNVLKESKRHLNYPINLFWHCI